MANSPNSPWAFTPPKGRPTRLKISDRLQRINARIAEVAAKIADDPLVTDAGKRKRFTEEAKLQLLSMKEREAELRVEQKKILRERTALRESKAPMAPSLAERQELYALAAMARESERNRDYFFKILNTSTPDEADRRIQLGFLSMSPHLLGATGAPVAKQYQTVLRHRLGIDDLGTEGDKLDERELTANAELESVRALRTAVLQAADREELHQLGFAPKPVTQWTRDEVRAFVAEHGVPEYTRVLMEEASLNASPSLERIEGIQFTDIPDDAAPGAAPAFKDGAIFIPA